MLDGAGGEWRASVSWAERRGPEVVCAPVEAEPEAVVEAPKAVTRQAAQPTPVAVEPRAETPAVEAAVDEAEPETDEAVAEAEPVMQFPDASGKWRGTHDGDTLILRLNETEFGELSGQGQTDYLGVQTTIAFKGRVAADGRVNGTYTFLDDPTATPVTISAVLSGSTLTGTGLSLSRQ